MLERKMHVATIFAVSAVTIDFIFTDLMVSTVQKYGQ